MKGPSVIDIGCGEGLLPLALADKKKVLEGILDKSVSLLDNHFTEKVDQLSDVIKLIQKDRNSRRIIVSSWNPIDIEKMALPPCHCLFQFYQQLSAEP